MQIVIICYRFRILKVICRDLRLAPDFDFDQIASLTPGFVGADIQALAREAAMCAVDRLVNGKQYRWHSNVNSIS